MTLASSCGRLLEVPWAERRLQQAEQASGLSRTQHRYGRMGQELEVLSLSLSAVDQGGCPMRPTRPVGPRLRGEVGDGCAAGIFSMAVRLPKWQAGSVSRGGAL